MDKILEKNIVTEMRDSFIEYSMSVIISRALPDLRDGLKPVHRRILWGMFEGGVTPDKSYRKSARTVGDVMGKYHPHGDSSIYDAMVRMAQEWSYRHTLVDDQGNFGNQDGDGAAAMRYTEAKLSKIAMELLKDINKDTVDFADNFDGLEKEPKVLPSRFPNVLVNGSMGIAVGMATNIPPHNLGEVIDGCVAYINNNDITISELMEHIKGPDFPTGGIILGNGGIRKAYETGRGSITLRGKAAIEEHGSKTCITVTEIPYMVNTDDFQERVGKLISDKVLDGISDIENISSRPLKFSIVLKRDANPNVVLNNLYKYTQLQISYGINLLLIDQNQPKTMNLKDIISKYIDYQIEVIVRRTKFELAKAESRIHILEGFKIALDHMDEVIKLIRASKTDQIAKEGLMEKFSLSEIQSDAILEMKLRRLTGLEREKVENEYNELMLEISRLNQILADHSKVLEIIKQELLEIKEKYSNERRTIIDMTSIDYIEDESLIPVENVVIALTNKGYIKRMLVDTYRSQNRGGVGIKGMTTNEEDFVEKMISMRTHDYIMFFSNIGKVYRIKGYEIPEYSRQSKGLPLVNLLPLEKEEHISSIVVVDYESENSKYLAFITKSGLIKRTNISEYENIRKSGKIAILLKENDELITVKKTTGNNEIIICSSNGRMVRFNENEVRASGRNTSGVKGIAVGNFKVVGAEIVLPQQQVLIITEKGYGKKTYIEEFRLTHRGSKGVKALNITEKNGNIVSFRSVDGNEDIMIITDSGMIIRIPVEQISTLKRNTQGVRLINLRENQKVATLAIVDKNEEEITETEE